GNAYYAPGYCVAHWDDTNGPSIGNVQLLLHDGTQIVAGNAGSWPRDTWGHFAWVVDRQAQTLTTYVNGTAITTVSIATLGDITTSLPFRVGRYVYTAADDPANNALNYQGSMDELRVYGRALSASEVSALWATNTGSTLDLLVWLPLENSS